MGLLTFFLRQYDRDKSGIVIGSRKRWKMHYYAMDSLFEAQTMVSTEFEVMLVALQRICIPERKSFLNMLFIQTNALGRMGVERGP